MTLRPSSLTAPMALRSTGVQPSPRAQQPWLSKLHVPCRCSSGHAWKNVSHVCGCSGKGSGSASSKGSSGKSGCGGGCGGGASRGGVASAGSGVVSRLHAMHVPGTNGMGGATTALGSPRAAIVGLGPQSLGGAGGGLRSATGGFGDPTRGLGPPGSPCCCDPPGGVTGPPTGGQVPGRPTTGGGAGGPSTGISRSPSLSAGVSGPTTPTSYYRCDTRPGGRACSYCGTVRTPACPMTSAECHATCGGSRGLYGGGLGGSIRSSGGPCPEESVPYTMRSGCSCPGVMNRSGMCRCGTPSREEQCCCCPLRMTASTGPGTDSLAAMKQLFLSKTGVYDPSRKRTHTYAPDCFHVDLAWELIGGGTSSTKCGLQLHELYAPSPSDYPSPKAIPDAREGRLRMRQDRVGGYPDGFYWGEWNNADRALLSVQNSLDDQQRAQVCPSSGTKVVTDCPSYSAQGRRFGVLLQYWRLTSGCKVMFGTPPPKLCPDLCMYLLFDYASGLLAVKPPFDCGKADALPEASPVLIRGRSAAFEYFRQRPPDRGGVGHVLF